MSDHNMDELNYGWRTKTFSNKKMFIPCEEVDGVKLEEAVEIAHLGTWFFPNEVFESSASVLRTENGSLFLEVNFMDSFIMPIELVQEAEAILKEIWN